MAKARVVDTKPVVVKLEPGTYWWCACGESKDQPFCDGSHAGTGFAPVGFSLDEAKRVALCLCKRTGDAPYCDGSHARLD